MIKAIHSARRITALTGAGISKESGIPTFREAQTGLWAQYDPMQLATPMAFQENPKLVWEWYQWRRELVSQAEPNPGHYALGEMSKRVPAFTLITQNVDGLHEAAGCQPPLELHGNIQRTKCSKEGEIIDSWKEGDQVPPICPNCGAPLRPDVVWFGETLPPEMLQHAAQMAQLSQVFFSIGTSSLIEPAASLPLLALQTDSILIEINPDTTPLTPRAHYALKGKAGEVLPALVDAVWNSYSGV